MSFPRLYLYVPPSSRPEHPFFSQCVEEAKQFMRDESGWEDCKVEIVDLDDQLGFNLANEVRRIKSALGPVIFVSKVQHKLFVKLSDRLSRDAKVYKAQGATCGIGLFEYCEEVRLEYLGGEPKISRRELICFLIVTKLRRMDKWAGGAKYKSFLRDEDLPKGGFPSDVPKRDVLDAANVLKNAGILESKRGDGRTKYGLGEKGVIEEIIKNRSFAGYRSLEKWFQKDEVRVPAMELTKNYV